VLQWGNKGSSGKMEWEGKEEVFCSMQRSGLHSWSFYWDKGRTGRELVGKEQRIDWER